MLEFCVGYGLILAAIWTVNPWQSVLLDRHHVDCGDHVDGAPDMESPGPWAPRADPVSLGGGWQQYSHAGRLHGDRLHSLHRSMVPLRLISHVWDI